jgi:hypothetical protein
VSTECNRDLSARFASMITSTGIERVTEHQPVRWHYAAWQNHWQQHPLPQPHVLDELQGEYTAHDTIRRSFVFTYRDRDPVEFFIAVMAWGLGPHPRGPAKVGNIVNVPEAAGIIKAVVDSVRQGGAAAGYSTYFSGPTLPQLNIAFITKLLYFAGYQETHRPRPLIYDNLVATAVIRLPDAPLLPSVSEQRIKVSSKAYQRYCCWAEQTAAACRTDPAVVEWALFSLGQEIRDQLRATKPPPVIINRRL